MSKLILIGGPNNNRLLSEIQGLKKLDLEAERYFGSIWKEWPEYVNHPNPPKPQHEQFEIGISIVKQAAGLVERSCIYVVTHSDHILNGIRVGVKRGYLNPSEVKFRCCISGKETIEMRIDRDGNLDHWPIEFFSELEKEYAELIGF